jgi:hypothetical protein
MIRWREIRLIAEGRRSRPAAGGSMQATPDQERR